MIVKCNQLYKFTLLNINFQSLANRDKWTSLAELIDDYNVDVIFGTETWLKSDILTTEIFALSDFNVYRKDRATGNRGGGVLIAVKKSIISCASEMNDTVDGEQIWCSIKLDMANTIHLCSFYRPPTVTEFIPLYNAINNIVAGHAGNLSRKVIIGGDFNCNDINWKSLIEGADSNEISSPPSLSQHSDSLLDIMYLFNLKQLVTEPTRITAHSSSILDLIFTNLHNTHSHVKIVPGISDHNAVVCEFQSNRLDHSTCPRKVWIYKKANWDLFKKYLLDSFDTFK